MRTALKTCFLSTSTRFGCFASRASETMFGRKNPSTSQAAPQAGQTAPGPTSLVCASDISGTFGASRGRQQAGSDASQCQVDRNKCPFLLVRLHRPCRGCLRGQDYLRGKGKGLVNRPRCLPQDSRLRGLRAPLSEVHVG